MGDVLLLSHLIPVNLPLRREANLFPLLEEKDRGILHNGKGAYRIPLKRS